MPSTRPKVTRGHLVAIVDRKWSLDRLPKEDIAVPVDDLPDPDSEQGYCASTSAFGINVGGAWASATGRQQDSSKEIERKWADLALYRIDRSAGDTRFPSGNNRHSPASRNALIFHTPSS